MIKTPIQKAIETTEVVLSGFTGFTHKSKYAGLHNAVMKRAKLLKVAYIGERTSTTQQARNERLAEIERHKAETARTLARGGRLTHPPYPLPMYTTRYGPVYHNNIQDFEAQALYCELSFFVATQELNLDFTSLRTFHYTDPNPVPGTEPFNIARNALISACRVSLYDQPIVNQHTVVWMGGGAMPAMSGGLLNSMMQAGAPQGGVIGVPVPNAVPPAGTLVPVGLPSAQGHQTYRVQQPAVYNANPHITHPKGPVRQLKLILPQSEVARLNTIPQNWVQHLITLRHEWVAYQAFLSTIPSFEVLWEVLATGTEVHLQSFTTPAAAVIPRLTEYEVDVGKGMVAYKQQEYHGIKEENT